MGTVYVAFRVLRTAQRQTPVRQIVDSAGVYVPAASELAKHVPMGLVFRGVRAKFTRAPVFMKHQLFALSVNSKLYCIPQR